MSRSVRSDCLKVVKSLMFVMVYGSWFQTAMNDFVECGVVLVVVNVFRVM